MKAILTQTFIESLKPKDKYYDVWCIKMQGLHIRVSPQGTMIYRCLIQRGKVVTVGRVGIISLQQAKEKAKHLLAQAIVGELPSKRKMNTLTLQDYIIEHYRPWRLANYKRASEDLTRIQVKFFPQFGKQGLNNLAMIELEKWCAERLKNNIKPATINRDVTLFKSALSKAVQWKLIDENPFKQWKRLKCDSQAKIRYLTPDEEKRLRQALDVREVELKEKRTRGNQWRAQRGYELKPELSQYTFADHIKPMVLLTLNTGLRRGECLSLQWSNINFQNKILTIVGQYAKSGKTRHIPLNQEVLDALIQWQAQCPSDEWVFPNQSGKETYKVVRKPWCHLLRVADIKNFRWHDLRHHFASKLVMREVDLNTVRELLGHADLTMTLRYAHLAPEHKANAVAKLLD